MIGAAVRVNRLIQILTNSRVPGYRISGFSTPLKRSSGIRGDDRTGLEVVCQPQVDLSGCDQPALLTKFCARRSSRTSRPSPQKKARAEKAR